MTNKTPPSFPSWKARALEHYEHALQDAARRGFSLPIALLRAVERLRATHFRPPHLVRIRIQQQPMLTVHEAKQWPLPCVDWNDGPDEVP